MLGTSSSSEDEVGTGTVREERGSERNASNGGGVGSVDGRSVLAGVDTLNLVSSSRARESPLL